MNKKTRAEKWAEAYLNSEEYKEDLHKQFLDWAILGKPTNYLVKDGKTYPISEELISGCDSIVTTTELTLDEIIQRFNPSLETIEHIKRIQNG